MKIIRNLNNQFVFETERELEAISFQKTTLTSAKYYTERYPKGVFMIPPILTKLFEKFSLSNSRASSPSTKSKNTTKGDNSPITSSIVTNVYNQSFNEESIVNKPLKLSVMTPIKIMREVKSRPLYQQGDAGKNYIGNSVTWKLKLSSIQQYNDILNILGVQINESKIEVAVVRCEVKEKQYPRLQTLNQYDEFYITGIISNVNGSGIEIKDTTLSFVD